MVNCPYLLQALCLLLFFFLVPPAFAGDVLHALKAVGSTELSFKDMTGGLIRVTITQSQLDSSYPYRGPLLWGGDTQALPQRVVSSIKIQKDNKGMFVPLSAYADLGDAMSVSFDSIKDGFRVSLHGGNTATSYDATLFFERGFLRRREVRLRELPDDRWEKTTYAFPGNN